MRFSIWYYNKSKVVKEKGHMSLYQRSDDTGYPFKRNFYYDIEKAIDKSSIVFLLGPRKCGKTVGE